MKLIEVHWLDSTMHNGWQREYLVPARIISVGYLYHEDADFLTLTTSVAETGQVCAPLSIPRGAIVASRELLVKGGKPLTTKKIALRKKVAKTSRKTR